MAGRAALDGLDVNEMIETFRAWDPDEHEPLADAPRREQGEERE